MIRDLPALSPAFTGLGFFVFCTEDRGESGSVNRLEFFRASGDLGGDLLPTIPPYSAAAYAAALEGIRAISNKAKKKNIGTSQQIFTMDALLFTSEISICS
jgi:hypothetical protein